MNRWVLLEHKIHSKNLINIHYDLLIEDKLDCYTWKIYEIPIINGCLVKIVKQSQHRLIWLTRIECELSNNRGFVKRLDHGTFSYVAPTENSQELKYILNGKLLNGLLTIDENFCHLTNTINLF